MDRKVRHWDKPPRQRWLYKLADIGIIKALMIIWGICLIGVIAALLLVKYVVAHFK